jgi:hydroxyacylglutathione hydrolase
MNIHPIPAFTDNYIWAILDKKTGIFDCVDPGDAQAVLQFAQANQLQLRTILLTHHHYDHIGGVSELVKFYPTAVVYGPNDSRIPYVNTTVNSPQILHIEPFSFQILFNPGHTSTHISYYEPEQEWLFCGDTLFSAGCGRVFDGTMEQLYDSLQLFKSLPASTKVFCAHEYTEQNLRFAQTVEPNNSSIQQCLQKIHRTPNSCTLPSTLEQELLINPFFRIHEPEVKQYASMHGAISDNPLETFRVLRNEKNLF